MKKISLLLCVVFAIVSCNCQKKAVEQNVSATKQSSVTTMPKFEYTANSRGFYQKIIIENQQVYITGDRNDNGKGVPQKISDADWNELKEYYKGLKLDDLSTFKDPTQKRFYDGAAIADFKITDGSKEYQTTSFDHGFPPVEIEKLVKKIVSLGEK